MLRLRPWVAAAASMVGLALAACGGHQPAAQVRTGQLPSVADVHRHFVDAIGGPAAVLKPRSITLRGENTIFGAHGKRVPVQVVLYLGDFKRLEVVVVPHAGHYLSGYDGKTAWSIGPHQPPRIITGDDAASIRRDADLYYFAHMSQYFKSMQNVGIESFAGYRCYHLRGTTLWGSENNQYFDVRSGLLIGYRFHQSAGRKPEEAETRQVFERYRRFGILSFATRETDFADNKLVSVGRVNSVMYDDVNPRVFTPPAAVRALMH
ncbi:MAG TPA: hypothetical protein VGI19_06035 [Candidatus Cybelea sp.]